jgi:FAD dependent oxidoreductase.
MHVESANIVIVGAGVLGLTTALAICESLKCKNLQLTIIGEHGPHDDKMNTSMSNHVEYTSGWAGAHFRPFPSNTDQDYDESKLTRMTLKRFAAMSKLNPESSIQFLKALEYFDDPPENIKSLGRGYTEEIRDFKVLSKKRLPRREMTFGTTYQTWTLNPPVFLQFLYRKLMFEYEGVKFITAKLSSLRDVNRYVHQHPVIINCSGQGLQYEGGIDPLVFPIRGQTLLIHPPLDCPLKKSTITYQQQDGKWTFTVPRPLNGGIILGGTKQPNDTFTGVRESDTADLVERGTKVFPELMKTDSRTGEKYLDIIRVNVGFRPARKGGINISLDRKHGSILNDVINNYGAGGLGYEFSYGAGFRVYQILVELLSTNDLYSNL